MKLYISADMEGLANVTTSSEVNKEDSDYSYYSEWMSKEVAELAKASLDHGFDEILVKDAHASGRNIIPSFMPSKTKLLRAWTGDPLMMMSGLNKDFDAAIFLGYHSAAARSGNPLAHTFNGQKISHLKINGDIASEFLMNAYTASYYGVPVVAITGDMEVCRDAKSFIPSIVTIEVKEGIGSASISLAEADVLELINTKVKEIDLNNLNQYKLDMPESFEIELKFTRYHYAYQASFYPGAKLKDEYTITYSTDDYYEFLRMFMFVMK